MSNAYGPRNVAQQVGRHGAQRAGRRVFRIDDVRATGQRRRRFVAVGHADQELHSPRGYYVGVSVELTPANSWMMLPGRHSMDAAFWSLARRAGSAARLPSRALVPALTWR